MMQIINPHQLDLLNTLTLNDEIFLDLSLIPLLPQQSSQIETLLKSGKVSSLSLAGSPATKPFTFFHLTSLDISWTKLTPSKLSLPNIQQLFLQGLNLTDFDTSKYENLTTLDVSYSQNFTLRQNSLTHFIAVSVDFDYKCLKNLTKLETTSISTENLKILCRNNSLQEVTIYAQDADFDILKQKFPNVKIVEFGVETPNEEFEYRLDCQLEQMEDQQVLDLNYVMRNDEFFAEKEFLLEDVCVSLSEEESATEQSKAEIPVESSQMSIQELIPQLSLLEKQERFYENINNYNIIIKNIKFPVQLVSSTKQNNNTFIIQHNKSNLQLKSSQIEKFRIQNSPFFNFSCTFNNSSLSFQVQRDVVYSSQFQFNFDFPLQIRKIGTNIEIFSAERKVELQMKSDDYELLKAVLYEFQRDYKVSFQVAEDEDLYCLVRL